MFSCYLWNETVSTLLIGPVLHPDDRSQTLQWLPAQKMEGLLCCWALAMQEYFRIVYREGYQNANVDALSRCSMVSFPCCGLTMALPDTSNEELCIAQCQDPLIKELYNFLQYNHTPCLPGRNHPALRRYKQIWPQLKIIDGIVCREYHPTPSSGLVTVPILPTSFRHQPLLRNQTCRVQAIRVWRRHWKGCDWKPTGSTWLEMLSNIAGNVPSVSSQNFLPQLALQ